MYLSGLLVSLCFIPVAFTAVRMGWGGGGAMVCLCDVLPPRPRSRHQP